MHYNKVGEVGQIVCEDIDSYINNCYVLFRHAKKKKMGIMNRIIYMSYPISVENRLLREH